MSTRSTIGIENGDGTTTYIYCHWDGYLDYNGRMLIEHYDTKEKVEALIALGDLSSLDENVSECVAYHRDRGEEFNQEKIRSSFYNLQSMRNARWAEFVYLWKDGEWFYQDLDYIDGEFCSSDWRNLKEAVENLQEE